jgi:hypothetical protein
MLVIDMLRSRSAKRDVKDAQLILKHLRSLSFRTRFASSEGIPFSKFFRASALGYLQGNRPLKPGKAYVFVLITYNCSN